MSEISISRVPTPMIVVNTRLPDSFLSVSWKIGIPRHKKNNLQNKPLMRLLTTGNPVLINSLYQVEILPVNYKALCESMGGC